VSEIKKIEIGLVKIGEFDQRMKLDEDEVDRLASSIARVGLLYPIIVLKDGEMYIVIDGHTRLAACKKLGHKTIACTFGAAGGSNSAEIAFAGNYFRADLSPIELAAAIKDCVKKEEISIEDLADGFHRTVHWVNQMLAIAEWPADVQLAVHSEGLSVSAASNLALVTDDSYRSFLVRNGIEGGATARTTASWLQAWRAMQPQEEAIEAVPLAGVHPVVPMVPQAPCLCCSQLFEVNMMSHVPVCAACIQIIRSIGQTQV